MFKFVSTSLLAVGLLLVSSSLNSAQAQFGSIYHPQVGVGYGVPSPYSSHGHCQPRSSYSSRYHHSSYAPQAYYLAPGRSTNYHAYGSHHSHFGPAYVPSYSTRYGVGYPSVRYPNSGSYVQLRFGF